MATSTIANPVAKIHGIENLFAGELLEVNDEVTLKHPISDYYFILLHFKTNGEHLWQLIPTEEIPIGTHQSAIHATIVGNSSNGQISYPPNYNASINVQFTTVSTVKCSGNIYSNSNFKIKLYNVHGVWKKS